MRIDAPPGRTYAALQMLRCLVIAFALLLVAPVRGATNLTLRFFPVSPVLYDVTIGERNEPSTRGGEEFVQMSDAQTRSRPRTNLDIKKYFSELGVGFPEGSYIYYRTDLSALLMYNTEVNHRRLGRRVAMLGCTPTQVEIDCSLVTFTREEIETAARQSEAAAPTAAQLKALWKAGKGRLAGSGKLLTRSGVNAQIISAQEVIYPTEFEATAFQSVAPTSAPTATGAIALPGSFETREAGLIFNVTPTVGPDNRTIDLTMVPEFNSLEGWDTIETPLALPGQPPATGRIQQPSFHQRQTSTSIVVDDGSTVIMGGLANRAGTEWLYFFITPHVIDARGGVATDFAGYPLDGEQAGGGKP